MRNSLNGVTLDEGVVDGLGKRHCDGEDVMMVDDNDEDGSNSNSHSHSDNDNDQASSCSELAAA